MSISSSTRKAGPFACNGATVAFPFAFKVFQASDVRVVRTDTNEAESDLVLNTSYTVALNTDQDANPGGTVTTVAAYAAGNFITLTSKLENLQPVTLTNQGGFYPKVINTALDRLTILVQQVVEQVGRAVKTPISSGLTPDQLIADLYAVEANAGNSATAAANSAANSAASAAAAAAVLDNFDDRYLGQKTTDPTLDNDGNALQIGALYYNTVLGVMRVYTGTGWIDAATGVTSDDVSFMPAGTGAALTNVQTKLREFVSVKDFGAVGDGVTDDTAAIQAAINYCTNLSNRKQTLYFPANNAATSYKVTAPLVITGRLNIVGDGQFSTRIQAYGMTSGQFVVDFDCVATDIIYHCGISNISIGSNNGAPIGIRLKNVSYMLMKQVYLSGLNKGIYITGTACFSNFFEEVTGYAITSYTVQWENFTGGGHYMFTGCTFIGSDGVYLASTAYTDSLTFYNCNFEQCTTTDLYVAGGVRGLTISACRSEGLDGGTSFLISPTAGNFVSGVTVTGCFWSGDFGNANPIGIGGNVQGFSITGNTVEYMGFQQFVLLNGAGEAGVISGNYCANSPKVVSAPRDGVTIFNNRNSSGALPEYWGTATWGVQEGTFTMSDASGAGLTFTQNSGKYTKTGRLVSWQAVLQFPTTSNGSGAEIAGLPFAVSASSSATRSGAKVDITDYVGACYVMQGYSTSTRFAFFYNAGNQLTNANLSGKTLYLSGTYTI